MTASLLLILAGCTAADADTDTASGVDWASAFAPYADCTLERTWYTDHAGGTVGYREAYEFDANGLWTHQDFYDVAFADGDLTSVVDITRDERGRFTEVSNYNPAADAVDYVVVVTWDDVGQLRQDITFPTGMGTDAVWDVTHDTLGRNTKEEADYAPFEGTYEEVWEYTYDADVQGRGRYNDAWQADHEVHHLGNELSADYVRTFDAQGRMLSQDAWDYLPDEKQRTCTVTYDEAGREELEICVAPEWSFQWKYLEITYDWVCP